MRKKIILTMLSITCLALTACGPVKTVDKEITEKTVTTAEKQEDASNDVAASEEKAVKAAYETEIFKVDDVYENSTNQQKVVIYEDNTATYEDIMTYNKSRVNTAKYYGTVAETKEGYMFTQDVEGNVEPDRYLIKLEGEKLVSVSFVTTTTDLIEVAGTYTGNTEEFGEVTLKIKEDQVVLCLEDGTEYVGGMYNGQYGWDFFYSNYGDDDGENYFSIDWIVELGDGTFTYKEYAVVVNEKYVGEYKLYGDLGEFVVVVNEVGEASATVTIDGVPTDMTGGVRTDYDTDTVNGFYLNTEDENTNINIEIFELTEGSYNYYGTITKALSAG